MLEEMYEFFLVEWQDKYGPRPIECSPDIKSEEFKLWLENNKTLYNYGNI